MHGALGHPGHEIASFDAEVVDVVAGDPAADAPRILFRFCGPGDRAHRRRPGLLAARRSTATGPRVAGAISESVGEYGGMLALATPIEAILGQPVEPPVGHAPGAADAGAQRARARARR